MKTKKRGVSSRAGQKGRWLCSLLKSIWMGGKALSSLGMKNTDRSTRKQCGISLIPKRGDPSLNTHLPNPCRSPYRPLSLDQPVQTQIWAEVGYNLPLTKNSRINHNPFNPKAAKIRIDSTVSPPDTTPSSTMWVKGSLFIAMVGEKGVLYRYLGKRLPENNMHATIPKSYMGYDQYTVPDTIAVKPTFVTLLKQTPTDLHGLSCHSFKFLWRRVNSKPATILLFRIAAYTFSDKLCRNSSTLISHDHSLSLFTSLWVADYYLNYSFSCLRFFGVNFFF